MIKLINWWNVEAGNLRSSHLRCSVKKRVLRNFARPAILSKKSLWYKRFPVKFAKFLRTPFLQNTFGQLLLNKSSYPLNDLRNFNEIFRTNVTNDNITSHEKLRFTLSGKMLVQKNQIFESFFSKNIMWRKSK